MATASAVEDLATEDASKRPDLPPGVWTEILQHLSPLEQFTASMVCKAWRSHALALLTPNLAVCLNSGAAAAGFARWLAAHGHKLHSLLITEYYFDHHGHSPFTAAAAGSGGVMVSAPLIRSRLGPIARVALWQGLHAGGRRLEHLHTLKVCLDDISAADAVAIGLCVMPHLAHLTLESNASAIGVTGAAGLVTLTSLQQLILPTQALGDQGLQFIGSNLINLEELNVHNDGHVTDDGMAALSGLTALTQLDLQGNVSITQAAMPTLAKAAPRLRELNLSWLAMVNDWGLGQLGQLEGMQRLILRATGVELASVLASVALQSLTALTRLDVSRCRVGAAGLAVIATSLEGLRDLDLADNSGMTSFTELRPLRQLSTLTKLNLSSPAASMRKPDKELTSVCCLTQLRHLALNNIMSYSSREEWLLPEETAAAAPKLGEPAEQPSTDALLRSMHRDLHTAAQAAAAQLTWPSAGAEPSGSMLLSAGLDAAGTFTHELQSSTAPSSEAPAAGRGATLALATSSEVSPWAHLLLSLAQLTRLTALEFAGNAATWRLEPQLGLAQPQQPSVGSNAAEPALLLLGAAAAPISVLDTVIFTVNSHPHDFPQDTGRTGAVNSARSLHGRWKRALDRVAMTVLAALGGALGFGPELQGPVQDQQACLVQGPPVGAPQLPQLIQPIKLQQVHDEGRAAAAAVSPATALAAADAAAAVAAADGDAADGGAEADARQMPHERHQLAPEAADSDGAQQCSSSLHIQPGSQGSSSRQQPPEPQQPQLLSKQQPQEKQGEEGQEQLVGEAAGSSSVSQGSRKVRRLRELYERLQWGIQQDGACPVLSQVEAAEVLELLLPNLRHLQFDW